MLNFVFTAVVAAIVGVGLVDVVKNFIPETLPTFVKTIISVVIEAVVALAFFLVFPIGESVVGKILAGVFEVATAVGIAQVGYGYIAKLIKAIVEKLKK